MEGSNPAPYFFVKEIVFFVVVFCQFLFLAFYPSHIIHFIIRLYNMYVYNTKEFSASNQFVTNDLVSLVC